MDVDVDDSVQAYVFYLDKTIESDALIKDIPFRSQWLSHCQFTSFENMQYHLVSLDFEQSRLISARVCITGEKNKYQIRRNINKIIDGWKGYD